MDFYGLYKPLRNYTRQFSILESLNVIRAYFQYMQFNQPLPSDIEVSPEIIGTIHGPEKKFFEWELDLLTREIIINGSLGSSHRKSLKNWKHFSSSINLIKNLENSISENTPDLGKNILIEMHRISHRQFPWQNRPNQSRITKYYKIYKYPPLENILIQTLGINTRELYVLGLAFTGCFLENFALTYPPDLQFLGIAKEKCDFFLTHFSRSLEEIRSILSDSQKHDYDYVYSFNQLKAFPLIATFIENKKVHIAPIPTFLFWRFTDGIFYELCNAPKFGNFFGESFQIYVGEVLKKTKSPSQTVYEEKEYHIGRNRKDTVDWILHEDESLLFIECKTKRVTTGTKMALMDTSSLEDDLDKMADFAVQTYKQIHDFINGYYPINFLCAIEKVFPIILTIGEWYAFGPKIIEDLLDKKIETQLSKLTEDIKDYSKIYPYTICSMDEFEKALIIMAEVGVNQFMSRKIEGEYRLWPMNSYIYKFYEEQSKKAQLLFIEDFKSIFPDFRRHLKMDQYR